MSKIIYLLPLIYLSSCSNHEPANTQSISTKIEHTSSNENSIKKVNSSSLNLEQLYGSVKRCVKTTSHARTDGNHVVKVANGNKYSMMFDSYGNALERHYFNSAGTEETSIKYEVNASHQLVKATMFTRAKKIQKLMSFQLDTNRKIIEEKISSPQGNSLYVVRYKYNSDGRLMQESKSGINSTENVITKYTYNTKGDCVQSDFYKNGNVLNIQSKSTFTKFDSHGNWTECIERTNKGSVFLVEREIEYY